MKPLDLVERWRKRVRRFWRPRSFPLQPLGPVLDQVRTFIETFLATDNNPEKKGD
jgi:hypothetical protein